MFIGEAPGRDEDLKGEPFVGRAGQLLTKILAAIDLRREDVYITNILKCRPPNNRDPQESEVRCCERYLKQQIALIQPRYICALGRVAAQWLLQTNAPLGALRAGEYEYEGIPVIATYHPAALLRNPNFKKPCWEDMKKLRDLLEQG
jgi:DNA polymerase